MKHMPGFNRLVADERKIMNATFEQADAGELVDVSIMSGRVYLQAKQIRKISKRWYWCYHHGINGIYEWRSDW